MKPEIRTEYLLAALAAIGLFLALALCASGQPASNYTATAEWDSIVDTNAITYRLYWSTNSFWQGTNQIIQATNQVAGWVDATNLTARTTALNFNVLYHFVVTGRYTNNIESDYSNQADLILTKPPPPHLKVNIRFQAALDVRGPWEDLADLGDFDVQPELPFYRALLTIHQDSTSSP